ncbi:Solitary outer membrane autotransporter beta-barrel domain [Pseudoalteromonas prydzensis]|uniref:Solitary outer membrane autotransporter beta-barrel domain n=1 Tax=Pseudoalteromonas prydzensis TaxID=182141 RepID=A0ABR9FL39_9GAMM|nr:Solitary outer membrane autotransporter beta-barrel domain [Pseudoalteromonas prydzensis]MBE0457519.1 Solitary outer membrane autotransporter beta-barrel domain [Pseudoalteromonas prydzensis]
MPCSKTLLILAITCTPSTLFANPTKQLESAFATSLVFTDGDSITLGYGNFDPNKFISPHHNAANEVDSLGLRNQLSVYAIPFDWALTKPVLGYQTKLVTQVSYLHQKQSVRTFADTLPDLNSEIMQSAKIGISFKKPISSKWFYQASFNSHYMHYQNDYAYLSEQSERLLKPLVEGIYTNVQSNAVIFNPNISLIYRLPRDWGYYEYKLNVNYYYGWALSQPQQLNSINPESWQTQNGIKATFNMFKFYNFQQSFYVKAQRIDLGADSQKPLGIDHFYEYGFGVLWDVTNWTDWFENFGIGININNGSKLDGGSIVFYFNEL